MMPRRFKVVQSAGSNVVALLLPDQPKFHWVW